MGLRFRKSFKIAPGVRVNVGKKGVGVSVGGNGLRYSVNSNGYATKTVGLPGTGLSYMETNRIYNSSAYKRNSQLKSIQREINKLEQMERNMLEVEIYENKIEMIKSIHKECDENINWREIELQKPPFNMDKNEKGKNEIDAIENLNSYNPSFFQKLFGTYKKKIIELESNIESSREKDKEEYLSWKRLNEVSKRVNGEDVDAYFEVIREFNPLDDLLEFGSGFEFFMDDGKVLEVDFYVHTDDVVPKEVKSLTKTGKVSHKKMTKTMYYDLQQDYVSSCSLRIARDMFALLPIDVVAVNAIEERVNTVVGKIEDEVILSVKIDRNKLEQLNMDLIDPSDSLGNFECNMKFKKTGGLEKVDKVLS